MQKTELKFRTASGSDMNLSRTTRQRLKALQVGRTPFLYRCTSIKKEMTKNVGRLSYITLTNIKTKVQEC